MSANTNGASSLRRDRSGWLADLVTALRDREILTPSFLILDSIRKDSGSEGRDQALTASALWEKRKPR